MSIVVIDDDPDFLDYVTIILSTHGYNVRTATTAETGLRLMRTSRPDLVIADVMMSYALDGWTVTHEMRRDPALRDIPIMMVSAIVSNKDDVLFPDLHSGQVNAFMTKPLDPSSLIKGVEELIRSQ